MTLGQRTPPDSIPNIRHLWDPDSYSVSEKLRLRIPAAELTRPLSNLARRRSEKGKASQINGRPRRGQCGGGTKDPRLAVQPSNARRVLHRVRHIKLTGEPTTL